MPNKHSYLPEHDLNRGFVYKDHMNKYDLGFNAIREFMTNLKSGNLAIIKSLFAEFSTEQKKGILNIFFDYGDIFNTIWLTAPMGYPIDLARRFHHVQIANYLKAQKDFLNPKVIFAYTKGAVAGTFFNKTVNKLPLAESLGAIGAFLTQEEAIKLALTCKNANTLSNNAKDKAEEESNALALKN